MAQTLFQACCRSRTGVSVDEKQATHCGEAARPASHCQNTIVYLPSITLLPLKNDFGSCMECGIGVHTNLFLAAQQRSSRWCKQFWILSRAWPVGVQHKTSKMWLLNATNSHQICRYFGGKTQLPSFARANGEQPDRSPEIVSHAASVGQLSDFFCEFLKNAAPFGL
jgi:hypothetical protein